MKLISYLEQDTVRPGLCDGEAVYALSSVCSSILALLDKHDSDFSMVQQAHAAGQLPEVGALDKVYRLVEKHEILKVLSLAFFQTYHMNKFHDAGFREVSIAMEHSMQKTLVFKARLRRKR